MHRSPVPSLLLCLTALLAGETAARAQESPGSGLLAELSTADADGRGRVLAALRAAFAGEGARPPAAAVVRAASELLGAPEEPPANRRAAVELLATIGDDAAGQALAARLAAGDPLEERLARALLRVAPSRAVVGAVVGAYAAAPRRALLQDLLGAWGEPAGAELARAFGNSTDPAVRAATAATLARLASLDDDAVDVLLDALRDGALPTQVLAVRVLGRARPVRPRVVQALARVLRDGEGQAQGEAVDACRALGPAAVPALPDLLGHLPGAFPTFRVRLFETVSALGPAAAELADPSLAEGLRHPQATVRAAALAALRALHPVEAPSEAGRRFRSPRRLTLWSWEAEARAPRRCGTTPGDVVLPRGRLWGVELSALRGTEGTAWPLGVLNELRAAEVPGLRLVGRLQLPDLGGLQQLPALRFLELNAPTSLGAAESLRGLPSLEHLVLGRRSGLPAHVAHLLPSFPRLARLELHDAALSSAALAQLPRLEGLRGLTWTGVPDPAACEALAGLVGLRELDLRGVSRLDGELGPSLAALPELRRLRLQGGRLSGALGAAAELAALEELQLVGNLQALEPGWLAALPRLRLLDLSRADAFSPRLLEVLAEAPSLVELQLGLPPRRVDLAPGHLGPLLRAGRLEVLRVGCLKELADRDLAAFAACRRLRVLELRPRRGCASACALGGEALVPLARLPRLRELVLDTPIRLDDAALACLATFPALERARLRGAAQPLSAEGRRALRAMRGARRLDLPLRAEPAVIHTLWQALPGCDLQLLSTP